MSQKFSLCFPCLEKVRTKFPVFPVPWPPCSIFWLRCLLNPTGNVHSILQIFIQTHLYFSSDIFRDYTWEDLFVQRLPNFLKLLGLFKHQMPMFKIKNVIRCYCTVSMLNSGLLCSNKPENEKK